MVNFVETACLMHDIGNPPFGHFGESAIQEWFSGNGLICLRAAINWRDKDESPLDDALNDFRRFDGNPQGLRVVSKLQWNRDEFGLNLTKTTLGAFLKYVGSHNSAPADRIGFAKRMGFFSTEWTIVQCIWDDFTESNPRRLPLAYIMEAADDIAYCISDLEDSFEKGIVQQEPALREIERRYLAKEFATDAPMHAEIAKALANMRALSATNEYTYTDFRTILNAGIVQYTARRFLENGAEIATGTMGPLLTESEPPGFILKVLKDYCREYVYTHESIQRVEIAGFNAITGLLDQISPLLRLSDKDFKRVCDGESTDSNGRKFLLEPKLLKLFPPRYLKVYRHDLGLMQNSTNSIIEWNARAHLVVDFISGMTDDFAMTTYRTLSGMRL
ncbi:putative deoxyguanosinetriphosphate triphosphohydrolase [Pigmentiphaga litoralis]|nr:putative deoxyguanosinetriphosphate triphosphohydrolase [Pigmentiphaga litoralis]